MSEIKHIDAGNRAYRKPLFTQELSIWQDKCRRFIIECYEQTQQVLQLIDILLKKRFR